MTEQDLYSSILQVFKGTLFCCIGLLEENTALFAIFHNKCSFYSTSYFSSEKDPGTVKIVSHILKSLFDYTLVKIKEASYFVYVFVMSGDNWLLIERKRLIFINISQNLYIKLVIFLWKIQVQYISIVQAWFQQKLIIWVVFSWASNFHHSLFLRFWVQTGKK